MKPALVLLAAGASRRLGECKALVAWNGSSTLERLARAGAVFDDAPPLVVTGADHELIAARAPRGVEVLLNPHWALGRLTSVRAALEARAGRALCIAPVDVPLVEREVFEQLAARWLEAGSPPRGWLAPRSHSDTKRFGHPIVIGPDLLGEIALLPADASLRELRARAAPLLSLTTPSTAILDDLDTPEDLSRLRARDIPPS